VGLSIAGLSDFPINTTSARRRAIDRPGVTVGMADERIRDPVRGSAPGGTRRAQMAISAFMSALVIGRRVRLAHACVLNSLKHPDEVPTLRRVYGPGFFLNSLNVYAGELEIRPPLRRSTKTLADSCSYVYKPPGTPTPMRTINMRRSRLVGRNVYSIGICWLLAVSLVHPSERRSVSTQNSPEPAAFQQALRHYRTGRVQDAIDQLAAWPVDRLAAAAKAAAPNLSSSDRMAAAILQAEVASALLDAHRVHYGVANRLSPNDGRKVTEMVNTGLALLSGGGHAPFGEQLGDEPRRWWYYAVASSLAASILLPEASQVVDIGLKEFHDDPLLLTARGTIAGRFHHGSKVAMNRFPSTKSAMADYKRALMLDPGLTIAKLRLGHLYVDLRARREATGWLQSVAAGASTDAQQYVAHLLLGRIAARAQDLEAADAEFRKAYGIGPGYQTACIALSRNEEVLDRPERAADLARDCLLLSEHDDPWPYYDAMGDPDALLHLRSEARSR
jgi:hypothetical protein